MGKIISKVLFAILGLVAFGVYTPIIYADSNSDLNSAIASNNVNEVSRLLANGADANAVNSQGVPPLYLAVTRNYAAIAKLLIDNGANINVKFNVVTMVGVTYLHIAANSKSIDVAKLLIMHGADVNSRTQDGETPLHWVSSVFNGISTAELLIDNGANINTRNKNGATPLMAAVKGSRKDTVALLIEKGADINARMNDGATALHIAAGNSPYDDGAEDIAILLVSNGADVNAKNNENKTSFNIASQKNPGDYALLFSPVPSVVNASFSCGNTNALNNVESKICSFPPLRFYDQKLNEVYLAALKASPNAKEIKDQQKRWLRSRNEKCNKPTQSCLISDLVKMYKRQIDGLNEIVKNPNMYIEM